jgi:hypothetical protein
MRTENLNLALQAAQTLALNIREAHTDAVNSENRFAEIALFDLISASWTMELRIKRMVEAAAPSPRS